MARKDPSHWNELLADAQRRLPPGEHMAQEAFTADRGRPVVVKLSELRRDTFYWFNTMVASALFDAAIEHGARFGNRLTIGYSAPIQLRANCHRLQHLAAKLDQVRVLATGRPVRELQQGARLQCHNTSGTPLAAYRLVLVEGNSPLLFIARPRRAGRACSLGFLTVEEDVLAEAADDIEGLLRGMGRGLATFERLEKLHQTTQQVARELESYSRRLQRAAECARRRPDLLTPAWFERIVAQSIAKMEQLKELPRRALLRPERPRR